MSTSIGAGVEESAIRFLGQHATRTCLRIWKCMVAKNHTIFYCMKTNEVVKKISLNTTKQKPEETYLATAIMKVGTPTGALELRALIDRGLQKTLVSEEAVQIPGLPK